MKKIEVNDCCYEIDTNYRDCFNLDEFVELCTDYFVPFDYILGDYSYDKLRLKGFYDSKHKNVTKYNDIKGLKQYVDERCAYGARYFLLKKIK